MIQWFPGHMNKAKYAIKELVADIDIVLEVLDARAPFSSCNPLLQNIIQHKKKIRLLNKSDLADPEITQLWMDFFLAKQDSKCILGNKNDLGQCNKIIRQCKLLAPNRNSYEKPLRVMITGIPNVGKSTLINQLIGKKSAKTGDIPAVTRANQCLVLNDAFLIYDTPGMMWQKIKYMEIGTHLALCNSIGRNAYDDELLALHLIGYLLMAYPNLLCARYRLSAEDLEQKSDEILLQIGRKRGALQTGGIVDRQKASEIIVTDFRMGSLGKISLETPIMWQNWIEKVIEEEALINNDESDVGTNR
ncbi:MAG: ribosome biogenesis GTPase YlqF [Bacteroidia bacterium]|nr:MAG: ribosome biogenesis GTPase YlqF [Bacteroidia bacterium]